MYAECREDPGLSSERFTQLRAGSEPGALTGNVILSWRFFDPLHGGCRPTSVPIAIHAITLTGSAPDRKLTMVLEPTERLPFHAPVRVQIVYRFSERPKTAAWPSWLKELATR